ncbi:MAG: peptide ABC transporter substrate-binding protein [Gammaproteobacteria bacterium]|jgi:oligopeptide transport system substrate-binding protein|nr:peptide ABC transporter substrate-binding protein [Gammaproteobacteria bacterium]MDH4004110.1 peptide ABC transporter substrate-binding protein [Gammaproteobacteria bacterium]
MKTIRLLPVIVVMLAGAAVTLHGCGKGGSDRDARQSDTPVLDRAISAEPESLDPQKSRSVQAADVLRDIGEGLVSYNAAGEMIAATAESWEISGDGLTYTFRIRPEARWSNGDPVTAADFVFGLQRLVDPATAAFYAAELGNVANAADIVAGKRELDELGVSATDERTLVISLVRPTPYLLSLLTHPSTFPVHRGSAEQHGDAFVRAGNLVSNGAYVLAGWEPGAIIELHRNTHYWNDAETSIDVVRHHVVTQEMAEFNRYRAGELHITSSVPPDNFDQIRADYPGELHIAPTLGVYYYGFNMAKSPFADNPELRQALSMAIDREVLVEAITGRGEAPAYSWVPPGVDNYEPVQLPYADLSRQERNAIAQSLYRKAGYSGENPLHFELRYNTSDTQQRIALAVQAMWRNVLGAQAQIVNVEFQVLLDQMREREVTEVFRSSWFGDYNDANTFLAIMQGSSAANMPGYSNAEYDELMRSAGEQVDLDRRRLYLEEAERVLLADHVVIPLYFYVSKHLVKPEVEGWQDNILNYHYSQHLSLGAAEQDGRP